MVVYTHGHWPAVEGELYYGGEGRRRWDWRAYDFFTLNLYSTLRCAGVVFFLDIQLGTSLECAPFLFWMRKCACLRLCRSLRLVDLFFLLSFTFFFFHVTKRGATKVARSFQLSLCIGFSLLFSSFLLSVPARVRVYVCTGAEEVAYEKKGKQS